MIYQPIENTGEYTTGTVYSEEYVKGLEEKLRKAKEIYEKQYTIKYRKKRFMEDKTVGDLMYEVLIGSDKK